MTNPVLKAFPAQTIINPAAVPGGVDIQLDNDKGYARVSTAMVTVKAFKRTRPGYEWLHDFYFGVITETGEVFANPVATVLSDTTEPHTVTFGVEFGDTLKIEGVEYRMVEDFNNNMKLEAV